MRYNAISLIRRGGDALIARGDTGTAYALHELANNLLGVMQGKYTLDDWNGCYVATGCEPLDLDKHIPPPADEPGDDDDHDE
jgi:hypothetical protein